ncbi:MAG TPA: hypothetical protein VNT79_14850 [Phycisphaerae bacterium]|nr:hypothetical protein [Phycisphaerae bacterium]
MTPLTNPNKRSILPMTLLGTVMQVGMVIAGHYSLFIRESIFALGGMLISLIVGAAWAASSATSKADAAKGGAIVGGLSALLGILLSVALGDTEPMILAVGTISSGVTGAIGGWLGYLLIGAKRRGPATA